jgi:sugar phosphate isomerase/epimerase
MIDVAISSWSLHTLFLDPDIAGWRAADFPRIARGFYGVRHLEYLEGDYAPDLTNKGFDDDKHAGAIRRACESAGVRVVCLAAINDLTNDDRDQRAADRARVLRLARHCEILGCPVIRVSSGGRRLDASRAGRLRDELRQLSDALAESRVRLAIENHPHVLDSNRTFDLLVEVVEQIGRDNVRLCPDVGAMAPGYWRAGLQRLAPLAAHVHLKPFVHDGPESPLRIDDYASDVQRILGRCGYSGAVTLEYLPSLGLLTRDFCEESRRALVRLARVFGYPVNPDPELSDFYQPASQTRSRTVDTALTPPSGILELLADGCELRLGAQIEIHDFATNIDVRSKGHLRSRLAPEGSVREDAGGPGDDMPHFCHLANNDPVGRDVCERFHARNRILIQDGLQERPQVFVCPYGLILLSVPITDDSNIYRNDFERALGRTGDGGDDH